MAQTFRKPNGELFEAKTETDVSLAKNYGYTSLAALPGQTGKQTTNKWFNWLADRGEDAAAFASGAGQEVFRGGASTTLNVLDSIDPEASRATAQGMVSLENNNPLANLGGRIAGGVGASAAMVGTGMALAGPVGAGVALLGVGAIAATRHFAGNADEAAKRYFTTPAGVESASSASVAKSIFTDKWGWGVLEVGAEMLGAGPAVKGAKSVIQQVNKAASKAGGIGKELDLLGLSAEAQAEMAKKGLTEAAQDLTVRAGLIGKSPAQAQSALDKVLETGATTLEKAAENVTGVRMTQNSWGGGLKPALESGLREVGQNNEAVGFVLQNMRSPNFQPTFTELQGLKDQLLPALNGAVGETKAAILSAMDSIDQSLLLLAKSTQNPAGKLFAETAQEMSAAARLKAGLNVADEVGSTTGGKIAEYTGGAAGMSIGSTIGSAAGMRVLGGVVGAKLGKEAVKLGASPAARYKAAEWIVSNEGKFVNVLNTVFEKAIPGAVGGAVGGARELFTPKILPYDVYNRARASIQHAATDPNSVIQTTYDALDANGVDPAAHSAIVAQNQKVVNFLNEKLPGNEVPGLTVSNNPPEPTKKQRQEFGEYLLAATDPAAALFNPTPRVIEALNTLYPELLVRVRETVNEIQAETPQLTPTQKRWVSQVTGIPKNKLAIPANNAIMNAGVQAAEAAGRAPAPYAPANRSSEMTTSQRLGAGVNEE